MDPTNSLSEDFADLSVRDQNEPTVVSTERDRSTEDDHKSLDAELMTGFSLYRKFNQEPDWPTLLSSIALGDKQLVTLTRRDAEGLLTSQPSINRVLQKAWENGSFKEVRQLSESFKLLPSSIFSLLSSKMSSGLCCEKHVGGSSPLLLRLVTTTRL